MGILLNDSVMYHPTHTTITLYPPTISQHFTTWGNHDIISVIY